MFSPDITLERPTQATDDEIQPHNLSTKYQWFVNEFEKPEATLPPGTELLNSQSICSNGEMGNMVALGKLCTHATRVQPHKIII